MEENWSGKNINLAINLGKINYEGDEELVQQIWINLIGNAIKFSAEQGTVYVTLQETMNSVLVEIKDEGIGMAEEIQRHIFEKFYKGDPARTDSGNGLGLAIVKRIMEICQGNIAFQSKAGAGTSFTVTLPKLILNRFLNSLPTESGRIGKVRL